MRFTVEAVIDAPLAGVWHAWTTPDDIRQWNAASADWHCPAAEIDLRPGGTFCYRMEARDGSAGFDFAGRFTRVVPYERIEYALGDERSVVVEFIAAGQGVIVRETVDAEPTHDVEQQRAGWLAILHNARQHAERGARVGPARPAGTQQITPFLWYDGQAEAAARCYVALLPDSRIDRVVRAPADHPAGSAGTVLTVEFTICGHRYVALNGGPRSPFTEAVSFQITCADQAAVDRLWDALSEGGSAGQCGWLKDRWGLSWQIVPARLHALLGDPDEARARRAMAAMLTMHKLDIAELERAADGA
ncbi:MAG: VOC family protein [Chloroflexi bacterium]|nr:VOC family protein [Chloroflexota bacterium]